MDTLDGDLTMLEREHKHRKHIRWDSPEEWELETRAFHANEEWPFEEIRDLISELWFQYCGAKILEIYIDELKEAVDKDDRIEIMNKVFQLINEKEKLYE